MGKVEKRTTSMRMKRPTKIRVKRLTGDMYNDIIDYIHKLPKKYKLEDISELNNERRVLPEKLKREIVNIYFSHPNVEIRRFLSQTVQIHQNTIARWRRGRTSEIEKEREKKYEQALSPSRKIMGKSLKSILNDVREEGDVLKQSELFNVLKDTGLDSKEIIKEISTVPTEEEFKAIMSAVEQLSEKYTIKRKTDA
jgi:hypothetical protein